MTSDQKCRFFLSANGCKYGSRCHYLHIFEESSSLTSKSVEFDSDFRISKRHKQVVAGAARMSTETTFFRCTRQWLNCSDYRKVHSGPIYRFWTPINLNNSPMYLDWHPWQGNSIYDLEYFGWESSEWSPLGVVQRCSFKVLELGEQTKADWKTHQRY